MEKAKKVIHQLEPFDEDEAHKDVWVVFLNSIFIHKYPLLVDTEEEN